MSLPRCAHVNDAKLISKFMAILTSFALCICLMPPVQAWASDPAGNTIDKTLDTNLDKTVTLTILAGAQSDFDTGLTTYTTWVNKQYAFSEGDTLETLLNYAVLQGDISGYTAPVSVYDGGKYLSSLTSKEGVTYTNTTSNSVSLYWSYFCDGQYGVGDCAIDHVKLQADKAYQFAWDSFTTAHAPESPAAWDQYYLDNPPSLATNTPQENPEPPSSEHLATGVDREKIGSLMRNIASSYTQTSAVWPLVGMAALGKTDTVDKQAFYNETISVITDPDEAASIQRTIIALSALGYDATCLDIAGTAFNAVEQMAAHVTGESLLNARISSLWAYASGPYSVPEDAALSEEALIKSVLHDQLPSGGFSFAGSKDDVDMTSMAILALTPYQNKYPEINNALNRALVALKNSQLAGGGFKEINGMANACSTAYAVMALCAAGVNPANEWATDEGHTPLSALLQYAVQDLSGFVNDASGKKDARATEQGFLALVAYQGLVNNEGPYNIIEQARYGTSTIPADTLRPSEKADNDNTALGTPQSGTALAQTSDSAMPFSVWAGFSTLISLLALGTVARRRPEIISVLMNTKGR